MSEKIQRAFRDQPLTPAQIAADQEVRRRVHGEFPPAATKTVSAGGAISELLRSAIRASGKHVDQVAADAGVSPTLLSRFLAAERDIHVTTADRVAESLGLKVAAN